MPEQLRYFYTDNTKTKRIGAKGENGAKKLLEKYPNAIEYDAQGNEINNRANASPLPQPDIPPLLARPAQQPQQEQPAQQPLPSLPSLQSLQQPESNNEYLYPKTGKDAQTDVLFEQIRDTFNTGRKAAEEETTQNLKKSIYDYGTYATHPSIGSAKQTNEMMRTSDPANLISAALEKNIPHIQKRVFDQLPYTDEYKGVMAAYKHQLNDIYKKLQSEKNTGGKINLATSVQQLQEQTNARINQIAFDQLNKAVNDIQNRIIKEEYVDKDKIENAGQYIIQEGVRNSIIGKLLEMSTFAGTSGIQRQIYDQIAAEYNPSTLTQLAAGVTGLAVDAPLFALGGGIGAAAGRPLINAATKQAAKGIITRGAGVVAPDVAMQMASKTVIPQIIRAGAGTSGALGTHGAVQDVLNQQKAIQLGQQESYDPLQTLKEGAKGSITGAVVGPIGAGAGKLMSMTSAKLAKGVIWTGGFAAENAAFVGSGALLSGEPFTPEALLHSAFTLGMLKLQHISTATIKERMTPNERFGGTNYNTERAFNIQRNENYFTPEEMADLARHGVNKNDFIESIAQAAKAPETLKKIIADPEVAATTKMKLRHVLTGEKIDKLPYITTVSTIESNGKYIVETYSSGNALIERRTFNSKANAKDYETKMLGLIKDQSIMELEQRMSETSIKNATEKVKNATKLSEKELEKIFKKEKRTKEEESVVEQYSLALLEEYKQARTPKQLPPAEINKRSIAKKVVEGNREWTPEELQYYQNNPKEVENEITAMQYADAVIKTVSHKSGAVIVAADADGNQYFVKDGDPNNPQGTIIVVNAQTGESKQISPEGLQFQEAPTEEYQQTLTDQFVQQLQPDAPPSPGMGDINGRPLSEEQAAQLIGAMEQSAVDAPQLELTPENWYAEFGEAGTVETPLGEVKMGENQLAKLILHKRTTEFGMIKPTLTSPDIIVEDTSEAIEGQSTERSSSYLFIKTFNINGKKVKFFTSVTVRKEGLEVVISSHILRPEQLSEKLTKGNLLWNRFVFNSDSSGENQGFSSSTTQDPSSGMPGSTPQSNSLSDKSTENSANNQIFAGQTLTINGTDYTVQGRDENGNIVLYFENEDGMPEKVTMPEAEVAAVLDSRQRQTTADNLDNQTVTADSPPQTPPSQNLNDLEASEQQQVDDTRPSPAQVLPKSAQVRPTFEIDKGATATENPDGTYSLNTTYTKSELDKAGKFIKKLNADYEDNGLIFELVKLPKRDEANPFEKPAWGIIAKQVPAEAPSAEQEIRSNEDYYSHVAQNSADVQEIVNAYNSAMSESEYENLLPWQTNLLRYQIHPESWGRFGDRNKSADLATWMTARKQPITTENSIDTIAKELSEDGLEVTPEMIVEFMESHPRRRAEKGNEYTDALNERFKAVASKIAKMPVAGITSPSGKRFINTYKNAREAAGASQAVQPAQPSQELRQSSPSAATEQEAIITEATDQINADKDAHRPTFAQMMDEMYSAEHLKDENNIPFVSINGNIDLGTIKAETGLTEAPIRLSEGIEYSNGQGYGLIHIEKEHGEQIRNAGYNSIEEFVAEVANNYTTIRQGNERGENKTYLLEVTDTHNNTLFVELSNDGSYWNVNSAGIFRDGYSAKKNIIWTLPTVSNSTNADAIGVNHGTSNGATVTSGNSPQTDHKDTTNSANNQEKEEKKISAKERIKNEKKLLTKEALEKTANGNNWDERSVNFNDPVYDFDYFGFTIEHAPKGKYNLSLRFKIDRNGKQYNPYITYKDNNITIDRAVELVNKEYDRIEKIGIPRLQAVPITSSSLDPQGLNALKSSGITEANAQEMQRIKEEAQKSGTFMKAPNGKPSNLNERQWLQVRTQAFKKWFGDWENDPENASKVVDENDEPMAVSHSTNKEFTAFKNKQENDSGWLGAGYYFFGDRSLDGQYGKNVMNVFLNIREPYYAADEDAKKLSELNDNSESEEFTNELQGEGYDGVYYNGNLNQEYVAFSPNQIKSATDNNGNFDSENNDIRYMFTGEKGAASLEAVNARFNEELQQYIAGKLHENHQFTIENLKGILSALLPDIPFRIKQEVLRKAKEKHDIELSNLKDLPFHLANPIAVFKSKDGQSKVVLTEIQDSKGNNVVAAIHLNKTAQKGNEYFEINDIRSLHGKEKEKILHWINDGLLEYSDKEKSLNYISEPSAPSNSEHVPGNSELLNSATKIIQDFQNPKLSGENSHISDRKFTPISPKQAKALVNLLKKSGLAKEVIIDEAKMREYLEKHLGKEGAERFMTAWHGTSADFDRFKKEFMLTGEGVMAYGAGFYFTSKENIANSYSRTNEPDWSRENRAINTLVDEALNDFNGSTEDAIKYFEELLKENWSDKKRVKGAISVLKSGKRKKVKNGNLLKVKIHGDKTVDELNFMRWDKPLSGGQIEIINKQLGKKSNAPLLQAFSTLSHGKRLYYGQNVYDGLKDLFGSAQAASDFLLRAGIDGIQYPTEYQSRGQHEDSFNYVVFDENAIEITNKTRLMTTPKGEVYGFVTTEGNPWNEAINIRKQEIRWEQGKKEAIAQLKKDEEQKYIDTGKENENGQKIVLVPRYRVNWYYAENSNPEIDFYSSYDEAIEAMNEPGSWDYVGKYFNPYNEVQIYFDKGHLDEDGDVEIDEEDVEIDEISNDLIPGYISDLIEWGYESTLDTREFTNNEDARDLEFKVLTEINDDIIKEYEGLEIRSTSNRKYRDIDIYDKDDNLVDNIKLRVSDHSYNPANNDMDAREGKFISVEITNNDPTAHRFHGRYSLKFDSSNTYEEIVDAVNEKIMEIIDEHGISPREFRTPDGEVYGAVKGSVVYLDPNKLNANTPIHEFGHLWNDTVRSNNPELWAKIKELTKETPYFKDLLDNPAYANLKDDDARVDEAFAQAMGDEGERIFNDPNAPKSIKDRFKQLLKEFWEWLGHKLGIRDLSPEQISRLTFEQAVKGAVADVTSGKTITFKEVADKITRPETKSNLQNQQKNSNFVKNSSNETTETRLDNRRAMGSSALHKLVESEPQGRRIEQTLAESNRSGSAGTTESGIPQGWSKSKIDKLFDIASKSKEKLLKETIGKATEKQLSDIRAAGIDISEDYIHTIDNYAIVHSLKKHGNNKTEEPRGQLAITKQDFEKIPDILANYNKLTSEKNSRGQDVIIYQKSYEDGTTLYAEEIRVGRKELAMVSMYKTKRTQHKVESPPPDGLMPSNGVLSSTSKTPSEFSTHKGTNNSGTSKQNPQNPDVRLQISPRQKRQYTAAELQMTPDQLASPEPPTTPAKNIQGKGTGLIESMVDKHQRLYNTIKEIEKRTGKKVAAADNPYDRLTKLSAHSQAALDDFKNKTFNPLLKRIAAMNEKLPGLWPSAAIQKYRALGQKKPFIQLFLSDTNTRRTFDFYMMAKHAPHRNAYIEKKTNGKVLDGSGISNAEAAAVVDIFEQQFTAKEIADFWNAVEKATDTSLNAWLDTGRITKETYDELKKELPYFVPLRSWDESETDRAIDAVYSGGGAADTYSAYKQAKGRSTIADSPLTHIANLAQSAIVFKEKNDVKQQLFDLAVKAKQPDLMHTKKIYTVETLDAAGNVVATRETATNPRNDPAHPLAPNERVVTKSMGTKNAISPYLATEHEIETWINGQKYILEFADEQVAQEINETTEVISKWLNEVHGIKIRGKKYGINFGKTTKTMSGLMTQKNPVFWTKNTLRDTQQAAIRLWIMYDGKMAGTFVKALPRATQVAFMVQFANKETGAHSSNPVIQKYIDYYEEYRKSGSRVGFMQMLDIDRTKKDIENILKHAGEVNSDNFLKKGLRAINGMASVSEDISRFAAFIAARESGKDVSEASSIAKEVTVNFNRSGKDSGIPGSMYAFFNATVQAAANQVEMFKKHPVKAGIAASIHTALGYLMYSAALLLLGDDDDEKDRLRNLSNYRKYINLFLPSGDNGFAQFPLSQTWRPFYAIGVAAAQVANKELTEKEALSGVWEQIGNISPIELSGNWEQLLPTAVTPLVENFIEERNYMGAPLVAYEYNDPDGKAVPFHKRGVRTDQIPLWQNIVDLLVWGDKSTGRTNYNNAETGLPEALSGIDISPDQLQHLIISYTGGLGSAINDMVNLTYSWLSGGKVSPNKVPIVSSYYSEAKPGYYTSKYYRLKTIYDQFKENFEFDMNTGRVIEYARAPEFMELQSVEGDAAVGQMEIDEARGKSLNKLYQIWDAQEKKMQKFSPADMVGAKDKDEIRKEVERISKETVRAVEPVFRELGIKY
jgi:hypothetical protein